MKSLSRIFVCALAAALGLAAPSTIAQTKSTPTARQMSADETRQANGVAAVSSATQKVHLLTVFLAAHPQSPVRGRLLTHVGVAIGREPDSAVRVALAEKFSELMSTDSERVVAAEILAEAYLKANRTEDAFQSIAVLPSAEAIDLRLLTRLVFAGAEESRQRNLKHLFVSQKYGDIALRAIDADLRPFEMNAARWADYKSKTLPSLHQSLGLLALHAGSPDEGLKHLRKAVELAPEDPQSHVFLGAAMNEEYITASQQLKQMKPGPARDTLAKKVLEQMNQVVDAYAHGLALATGSAQEPTVRAQVWPDLESYYKFLHNGSLDGLQALIDKYKKQ